MRRIEEEILVSTVTPVYAGKAYLRELVSRLAGENDRWQAEGIPIRLVEAVLVDDGSNDGSSEALRELGNEFPWVRVLQLSRNFGQHPATVAGVLHTCGDWVFTLDEDLQHEPRFLVPLLRHAVESRSDVVYSKSPNGIHQSKFRDWSSKGLKSLLAIATRNPFVKDFSSFRVVRGSIARAAASVSSHATYFDAALGWFTQRVSVLSVPMKDLRFIEQRRSGYTLRKLLSHAGRLLITLQTNWLRVGAFVGFGAVLFSFVLGGWMFGQKIISPESIDVQGWLSLFLTVLFFGGLTACLLGVLLEYMSTLVLHSQGKPPFFVVDRRKDSVLREYFSQETSDASVSPIS